LIYFAAIAWNYAANAAYPIDVSSLRSLGLAIDKGEEDNTIES